VSVSVSVPLLHSHLSIGVTPGDQLARNKRVTLQRAQEVHSHWNTQTIYVKKDHRPTLSLQGC
jgi:hypothetical protein